MTLGSIDSGTIDGFDHSELNDPCEKAVDSLFGSTATESIAALYTTYLSRRPFPWNGEKNLTAERSIHRSDPSVQADRTVNGISLLGPCRTASVVFQIQCGFWCCCCFVNAAPFGRPSTIIVGTFVVSAALYCSKLTRRQSGGLSVRAILYGRVVTGALGSRQTATNIQGTADDPFGDDDEFEAALLKTKIDTS